MSERMAYKMEPAGHEEPPKKRKYGQQDSNMKKLIPVFEQWLNYMDRVVVQPTKLQHTIRLPGRSHYEKAEILLEGIDVSIPEAHVLALQYQDHEAIFEAGLFISAMYNKSADKIIVYDLELDRKLRHLGFQLPKNKTLINKVNAGEEFGELALGTVINYGAAYTLGTHSSGPVINLGEVKYGLAYGNNDTVINYGKAGISALERAKGTAIMLQEPKTYGDHLENVRILKAADVEKIPALEKYLADVNEKLMNAKDDVKLLVKEFGKHPGHTIEHNIYRILNEGKHV